MSLGSHELGADRLQAALLDHVTDAVVVIDELARLRYANPSAELLVGHDIGLWLGRDVLALVHPDDYEATAVSMAETLAAPGRGKAHQLRLRTALGDYVWVEAVGNNQQDNPDIGGIVVCLRDIGERIAAQDLFRSAFDAAPIGMALVAPDGGFLQVNRSLSEMLGYPPEVLVTMTFQQLTHPHDLEADLALVRQMLAGSIDSYTVEKRYLAASGQIVWARLGVSMIRDPNGQPLHFVSQIQDITDQKQTEARLRRDSFHDPLTGLPNRRALQDNLGGPLRTGAPVPAAVLFCDLDDLKAVNDEIGHAAGDLLLQVTARRMRSAVPAADLVLRYGGDEFVVIASSLSSGTRDPGTLAASVRAAVERPLALGTTSITPRISIGIATPEGDEDLHTVLARADAAMYASKTHSREPGVRDRARGRHYSL